MNMFGWGGGKKSGTAEEKKRNSPNVQRRGGQGNG